MDRAWQAPMHTHTHILTHIHWQRGSGRVRSGSFTTFALAHWLRIGAPLWAQCRTLHQIHTHTIVLWHRLASTQLCTHTKHNPGQIKQCRCSEKGGFQRWVCGLESSAVPTTESGWTGVSVCTLHIYLSFTSRPFCFIPASHSFPPRSSLRFAVLSFSARPALMTSERIKHKADL